MEDYHRQFLTFLDQSAILCDDVHRALSYHDEVGLRVAMSDHGGKLRNSVRSTNVYEEHSLGIFEDENDDQENEADHPESDSGVAVWGRYLGRHVRRQLSFGTPIFLNRLGPIKYDGCTDLWWIALALFLICIVEVLP